VPAPVRLAGAVAVAVAAATAGAAAGLLGSFQSRWHLPVGGTFLPVGIPLAVLGTALVVAAFGVLTGSRRFSGAAAAGWLLAVVVLAGGRNEGDVVVAGDGAGLAWLGLGALAAAVPAVLPYERLPDERLPRRGDPSGPEPSGR
jgi:hypothetical protein